MRKFLTLAISSFLLMASTAVFSAISVIDNIDEPPLVAIGSTRVLNLEGHATLTINGQQVVFDDQTLVFASGPDSDNSNTTSGKASLRDGDYLYVFGELIQPGILLATEVYVSDEEYIEGVSRTYMKAILDRTETSVGVAYSGDSIIDYNRALHSDELSSLGNGNVIEILGTSFGSNFFADSGRILDTNEYAADSLSLESLALGQRGSGIRGQRGSGIRGQRGSGIRGQRGSGIRGQRGSGIRGQRGSGIRGQRGSGIR